MMLTYSQTISHETPLNSFVVEPTLPTERVAIELLLDQAFGPDRYQKTAYRFREGNRRCADLSFVVRTRATRLLCATIEFWPVVLVAKEGSAHSKPAVLPALLLGPIAVDAHYQGQGLGSLLMRAGLEAAHAQGHQTIILVGDLSYYGRFGFSNARTQGWQLPGPVEQARVLALGVTDTLPEEAYLLAPSKVWPPLREAS